MYGMSAAAHSEDWVGDTSAAENGQLHAVGEHAASDDEEEEEEEEEEAENEEFDDDDGALSSASIDST